MAVRQPGNYKHVLFRARWLEIVNQQLHLDKKRGPFGPLFVKVFN
jgi:hypothetical protein